MDVAECALVKLTENETLLTTLSTSSQSEVHVNGLTKDDTKEATK